MYLLAVEEVGTYKGLSLVIRDVSMYTYIHMQ